MAYRDMFTILVVDSRIKRFRSLNDAFEFSWRYQLPALVTLVPAGALGITVIIRWAGNRRGVRSGHAG